MDMTTLAGINWLLVLLVIYVIYEAYRGWKQGFAERLLRTLSTIVSLVIMWFLAPGVKTTLEVSTDLDERLTEMINKLLTESQLPDRLMDQLSGVTLPESIKQTIQNFGAADFSSLSAALADLMLSVIVFLVLFVLAKILIEVLIRALNLVAKIPGLRSLNHIGGLLMALLETFVNVELFFLILPGFSAFSLGMKLMDMVRQSEVLTWLF